MIEVIRDKEKWDSLIKKVEDYDFYHTYDYHMISRSENETAVLLKYEENKVLIGVPLLIRNVFDTAYKDATSVYGYAGPISAGITADFDNRNFLSALEKYLKENNIVSIFSRLNPFILNQERILKNYGEIFTQGKVVNIDLSLDMDIQRQNYQRRLKTHINKSRRNCTIRRALNDSDLQKFIDVYYENMDRVHAKKFYYFKEMYFKSMAKSNAFETETLLAVHTESNQVIAGSMFIKTNGIVQYHLSGTKNEFLQLMPTKLLIDEMRIRATTEGFNFFNLGGGLKGDYNDSLFRFKSSFSKDFHDFNLWKLIVDHKAYQELTSRIDPPNNTDFFPLYRVDVK
ncbi:peptidoglycan bridge formation glycyltransferase FemA/FemB family protein [Flavobacteriaceae bacterium 3-367]|uniref:peptidoglycan bridge formation glycyltransferase FemA/FemB family protein n=1 Tax=Eudoraea algarum TaxID=3417568 RepID=UPI00326E4E33